ncbi:glycosyltransferase [Coraliomargarita algicola]|uniref:Glycosyltransferase n=1 Tax=Coraliomargarita algicola TaxID=3092156 RepID=A0ABZ0RIT1_9BACT|nr:glycosyltransferase [Coraliomargarita sp. J2-16]WPJ94988.1 glycosyltransferase [Coraliomargarita sp. J2-16]
MSEAPSVSVIIPNYNGARFLGEAIDSVLSQQGVAVEVIVIDDGSSDGSRAIIESYGARIRSIFQQNLGACAARNAGLELAQGDYVKFLDSDDRLSPHCLSAQIEQSVALPVVSTGGKSIVYGDGALIDQNGAVITPSYFPDINAGTEATLPELIARSPLTSMPLHRASLLRAIGGFDVRIPAGQEYDLHLRLYFSGVTFVYQPTMCYQYRQHDTAGRISTSPHRQESFERRFDAYQRHVILAEQYYQDALPVAVCVAFADIFWETGRFAVRCQQLSLANKYFSQSKALFTPAPVRANRLYRIACQLFGGVFTEQILMKVRRICRCFNV